MSAEPTKASRRTVDLPLCRRRPTALYLHIPFCARICPYCDFAVAPHRRGAEAAYLDALAAEAEARLPPGFEARTVFIGGGTPTELSVEGLERLAAILAPWTGRVREVSIEANPGTLIPKRIAALRRLGVTRVSLGAQSFDPAVLETLGRFHKAPAVAESIRRLRAAGIDDINIDLMFAAPGQTLAQLDRDIDAALALEPTHLSTYGLTWEPGTPFDLARRDGRLRPAPEALEAAMFRHLRRRLAEAGFRHYEISNFARPGRVCAHNRVYWRNGAYVGLGNGAASHVAGRRMTNHRAVERYIAAVHERGRAFATVERLDRDRKIAETAYLALRVGRGLDREVGLRDLGIDWLTHFAEPIRRLTEWGLVETTGSGVRLNERGLAVADRVALEFLD